jgi:Invasion associated locus B (IalB) protein
MVRVMIRASLRVLLLLVLSVGFAAAAGAQQQPRSSTPQKPAETKGKPAAAAQSAAKPVTSGQAKPAAAGGAAAPAGGQAKALQAYGDWEAHAAGTGRTRVCYALSKPKSRLPANLKDVVGYLFVATRPAEKVRNEISMIMNFDLKESAEHQVVIGREQFALAAKGKNLWVKNPAEERRVIEAMKRANDLTVKGVSAKNNATTDKYSLKGFEDALERVQKECR